MKDAQYIALDAASARFKRYMDLIEDEEDDAEVFLEIFGTFESIGPFDLLPEPDATKAAVLRVALVIALETLQPELNKGDLLLTALIAAILTGFTAGVEYGQKHPEWCILEGL